MLIWTGIQIKNEKKHRKLIQALCENVSLLDVGSATDDLYWLIEVFV